MMCLPESLPLWRRAAGLALFILGIFLPSLIPLIFIVGIDGWLAAGLTVAFSVGLPELLWLLAALFIGREGIRQLWRRLRISARLLLRRALRAAH
jgi:hypothetical protein